ncbi:MAG TPA: SDR family oxidoreductase [Anaerolineaceae bacterium]|nr:SDR family oxidoreductase [Anaerolineaceae bacterium]HQC63710.1 SDR family oxidoreductase [Anaerolineaceae bacterium]
MELYEKTVLITGATDGMGKETALMFAKVGATVLIHGRNPKKLADTLAALREANPKGQYYSYQADYASLADVRAMAETIKKEHQQIDILINNAGLYPDKRVITQDGFELTLQVNYLSSFLLTHALMPLLEASPEARIVNVSSIGHKLVWNSIKNPKFSPFFWRWVSYCRSKLLVVAWTIELARRLESKKITVNSVHPGVIRTKVIRILPVSWGSSVPSGAKTIFNLATNPAYAMTTGQYFERYKLAKAAPMALNKKLQKNLWRASHDWAGLVIESEHE